MGILLFIRITVACNDDSCRVTRVHANAPIPSTMLVAAQSRPSLFNLNLNLSLDNDGRGSVSVAAAQRSSTPAGMTLYRP